MMIQYQINDYTLEFDETIPHTIYDEGYCKGVKFFKDTWCYEVINSVVGERLLINCNATFHSRDIPFNQGTSKFLPQGVVVTKRKV